MAGNKIKVRKANNAQTVKTAARSVDGGGMPLRLRLSVLLAVLSVIVYANSFKNGFVLDDSVMIVNNSYVKQGISAIPTLLVTPHQKGFWDIPDDEYRPLSLIVFAAVVQIFSLNPTVLHVLNVLLFAGGVVLLFRFLCSIVGDERIHIAFIASLLFGFHPIHTEVVANIKSMDELMCFFFALLTLSVFIKYTESGRGKLLALGALFLFLAALSKETAVTFVAIVPFIFFFHKNDNRRRSAYIVLTTVSVVAAFLLLRFVVLSYYHANIPTPVGVIGNALMNRGISAESRLATTIFILGYYVKLLLLPYPLNSNYSFHSIPYVHFSDPLVLLSVAFYIVIAAVGIRLFLKDRKNLYSLGIFWFLVTIALFANILVTIKSTMGERFLFIPSVGFCLVLAMIIAYFGRKAGAGINMLKRPVVMGVLSLICVAYSIVVINRNEVWKDNYTLYTTDLQKHPENAHLNYLVGYELFSRYKQAREPSERRPALDGAIYYTRKAVRILPSYYYALTDLGAAYFERGQLDSAEIFDKAAVKEGPVAVVTRNNLSGVYIQQKKYNEDISFCKETISRINSDGNAYADIGVCFMHLGQYDSAIHYLQQGISDVPDFYGCYDVLGYVYYTVGKADSAKKYKDIADQLKGR